MVGHIGGHHDGVERQVYAQFHALQVGDHVSRVFRILQVAGFVFLVELAVYPFDHAGETFNLLRFVERGVEVGQLAHGLLVYHHLGVLGHAVFALRDYVDVYCLLAYLRRGLCPCRGSPCRDCGDKRDDSHGFFFSTMRSLLRSTMLAKNVFTSS